MSNLNEKMFLWAILHYMKLHMSYMLIILSYILIILFGEGIKSNSPFQLPFPENFDFLLVIEKYISRFTKGFQRNQKFYETEIVFLCTVHLVLCSIKTLDPCLLLRKQLQEFIKIFPFLFDKFYFWSSGPIGSTEYLVRKLSDGLDLFSEENNSLVQHILHFNCVLLGTLCLSKRFTCGRVKVWILMILSYHKCCEMQWLGSQVYVTYQSHVFLQISLTPVSLVLNWIGLLPECCFVLPLHAGWHSYFCLIWFLTLQQSVNYFICL